MILLTTYDFYQNTYKGQLSSDLFDKLIPKASFEIASNVNRPLVEEDSQNETVEMVACMLVDLLYNYKDNNKSISSISIDGVSKTYSKISEDELRIQKVNIFDKLPIDMIRFL